MHPDRHKVFSLDQLHLVLRSFNFVDWYFFFYSGGDGDDHDDDDVDDDNHRFQIIIAIVNEAFREVIQFEEPGIENNERLVAYECQFFTKNYRQKVEINQIKITNNNSVEIKLNWNCQSLFVEIKSKLWKRKVPKLN